MRRNFTVTCPHCGREIEEAVSKEEVADKLKWVRESRDGLLELNDIKKVNLPATIAYLWSKLNKALE